MKISEHLLGPQRREKMSMTGHKLTSRISRGDSLGYTTSFLPLGVHDHSRSLMAKHRAASNFHVGASKIKTLPPLWERL